MAFLRRQTLIESSLLTPAPRQCKWQLFVYHKPLRAGPGPGGNLPLAMATAMAMALAMGHCPSFLSRELHWHRGRVGACPYRQDIGVGLMTFSQVSAIPVRGLLGAAACAAPNWPWNLATNPLVDQLGSTGH
jgi:hypothetical protein